MAHSFGPGSAPDGYDIATKLPPTIAAGESVRIAFVTNCDGEPVEIAENPLGQEPIVLAPFAWSLVHLESTRQVERVLTCRALRAPELRGSRLFDAAGTGL